MAKPSSLWPPKEKRGLVARGVPAAVVVVEGGGRGWEGLGGWAGGRGVKGRSGRMHKVCWVMTTTTTMMMMMMMVVVVVVMTVIGRTRGLVDGLDEGGDVPDVDVARVRPRRHHRGGLRHGAVGMEESQKRTPVKQHALGGKKKKKRKRQCMSFGPSRVMQAGRQAGRGTARLHAPHAVDAAAVVHAALLEEGVHVHALLGKYMCAHVSTNNQNQQPHPSQFPGRLNLPTPSPYQPTHARTHARTHLVVLVLVVVVVLAVLVLPQGRLAVRLAHLRELHHRQLVPPRLVSLRPARRVHGHGEAGRGWKGRGGAHTSVEMPCVASTGAHA